MHPETHRRLALFVQLHQHWVVLKLGLESLLQSLFVLGGGIRKGNRSLVHQVLYQTQGLFILIFRVKAPNLQNLLLDILVVSSRQLECGLLYGRHYRSCWKNRQTIGRDFFVGLSYLFSAVSVGAVFAETAIFCLVEVLAGLRLEIIIG